MKAGIIGLVSGYKNQEKKFRIRFLGRGSDCTSFVAPGMNMYRPLGILDKRNPFPGEKGSPHALWGGCVADCLGRWT